MTIAEVSRLYGISADTLRYYEKVGIIPPVGRKNGIRDYREQDCRWVEFIKCMREAGVQIEALTGYVALFRDEENTRAARKAILVEQRDRLRERLDLLQATLDRLDRKIENYDALMLPAEEKLRHEGP